MRLRLVFSGSCQEVDDGIWLVSFLSYDLGYIDLEQKTLQPLDNPFGTRLSPMSLGTKVTYVSGPDTPCAIRCHSEFCSEKPDRLTRRAGGRRPR
jgi:hypothetical protein